jgi:outer membrane protein assembly factor BamB
MKPILPCLILASLALGVSAETAYFRGPNHDGIVSAPPGVREWRRVSLKKLWKADTPTGFSSFAVAGGKAYTIVTADDDGNPSETLLCLDAASGKEIWSKPLTIAPKYDGGGDAGDKGNEGGDGPRSTPVVDGDFVYTIDANLGVRCHQAATGELVWERDVLRDNAGVNIRWQNAASPLIEGNLLLMAGGGKGQALLGLDKKTGAVVWKGENDQMTHATPIATTLLGTRQAIFFTQEGLVSVAPDSGSVLWRAPFPYKISTAASPVVFEDIVYCSAGYGVGAGAFKISQADSGFTATPLWRRENECFNHWSTPVVKDGYLYGMFSFKEYGKGPLACVDIRTGKDMWKKDGFGPGQVILAGTQVVALSDKGEVVIVDTNPEKYTEVKRQNVLKGKVWSYPVLVGDRLFARSTEEGVCLQLN